MRKIKTYLLDPSVQPNTQTCRIKVWAHDNAFTLFYISIVNALGWTITVISCHG